MARFVEKTYALPETNTVFDFVFRADLDADDMYGMSILCRWSPAETQYLSLNPVGTTAVQLSFSCGYTLQGSLQVRRQICDGVPSIGVFATLSYSLRQQAPVEHFQGFMFLFPAHSGPIPPPPPFDPDEPEEPPAPMPIITTPLDELFPYVYVRRWPKISPEDQTYGFFTYAGSSPPASSFVSDLAHTVPQGRVAMQNLAVDFIDGLPPYQGAYISSLRQLTGPLRDFAALAARLQEPSWWTGPWLYRLRDELQCLLDAYGETGSYLTGTTYQIECDQVWQSYAALVVTLGYDQALLLEFVLTLWLANAIALGLSVDSLGQLEVIDLPAVQRNALAHASISLPANIFPLPPAAQPGSPPAAAQGWIEPYAIGDLQMVRQRLLRYSTGEIARIENVMRGERKEVVSRRGQRQIDTRKSSSAEEQSLTFDDADQRNNLLEEISRTMAGKTVGDVYDNFSTVYGAPTQGTVSGTKNRITTAGAPGRDDVTRFARDILSKTVNRIGRSVGSVRASTSMSRAEHEVVSTIDNSAGNANLRAVFRWVNKVYEACVVNYGNRLMMEFSVALPAGRFLARQAARADQGGFPPVSLAGRGIASFEDITPRNYPTLCAAYGVTNIQPPPLPLMLACATLRGGENTLLAIPTGYVASTASASCVTPAAGLPPPQVLVGCQPVPTDGSSVALPPAGGGLTLPVSVADAAANLSPPAGGDVLVNIEVGCVPTARASSEWQIGIYAALVAAWQEQTERFRHMLAAGAAQGGQRSPLACREIETREMKEACIRLLLARMEELTGSGGAMGPGSPPAIAEVNLPRYVQYFDQALEWAEMAYTFHDHHHGDDDAAQAEGADPLFATFLRAGQANVLVPVQPAFALGFLYVFAAGMIWNGPDWSIAVNAADIPLVNDLKIAARQGQPERRIGACWEITVPTTMQSLDAPGDTTARDGLPAAGGGI